MSDTNTVPQNETKTPQFVKATDSRGREIEGLWIRNGRYYYQIYVPAKKRCQYAPLYDETGQPIRSLQKAQEAAVELRKKRSEGESPEVRRAPFFSDYYKHYLAWMEETDAKSDLTIKKERSALKLMAKFMGHLRLTQITRKNINEYALLRKKKKEDGGYEVSNRAVNLDVQALHNCLKFAHDEGWLRGKLVTQGWKRLEYTSPERPLWTQQEIDALCSEALRKQEDGQPVYQSGEQLVDFIKICMNSGARHSAALSAKWDQVDWEHKRLKLYTKFDKIVFVDFNERLEAHLLDMQKRRIPDNDYLFPSPRSDRKGNKGHLTHLYKTSNMVKAEVAKRMPKLIDFTPHDLRHYFISWCVMSGIDYMTISEWVGHDDGGILIGQDYGHLDPRHKKAAAKKVAFTIGQEDPQPPATMDLTKVKMEDLLKALQQLTTGQAKAA